MADQRRWERALIVVSGTPDEPHDPDTQAVVATHPRSVRGAFGRDAQIVPTRTSDLIARRSSIAAYASAMPSRSVS